MAHDRISVVGLGYIGLPTAALFASRRQHVIGVDVNSETVETINRGSVHIVEPELDIIVRAVVSDGYLRAVTEPLPADAFLIAVPTPFREGHEPDTSYIEAAARSVAMVLQPGNLVVLESTSPVGTTEILSELFSAARPDLTFPHTHGEQSDIRIAYCPERVLPGNVLHELVHNDRIIGGMTPACSAAAESLYRIFLAGNCIRTQPRTAEMCKLTENAFRDVNIAFANELSIICDQLGINVWELIDLANRHPRVKILEPGAGVGGHCIAVDPWFIVSQVGDAARMIRTARAINDGKPEWVLEKIRAAIDRLVAEGREEGSLSIGLLGLAFKANIDDLRESPALEIAKVLRSRTSAKILAVEPHIDELPEQYRTMTLCPLDRVLNEADLIIVLVGHNHFKGVDLTKGGTRPHLSFVRDQSQSKLRAAASLTVDVRNDPL